MKSFYFLSSYLLFFLFIFLRIWVRNINDLWVDEITEIEALKSLSFLVFEYLPSIPGGSPGHYLATLPIQSFFPMNKFALGGLGLIAQVVVFILIPSCIKMLGVKGNINIISFVTRLLFVFEPTLTFQAMEVRPYAILPLLWVCSLYLISWITKFDWERQVNWVNLVFMFTGLVVTLNWHYYSLIMLSTLYLYYIFSVRVKISNLLQKKSLLILLLAIIISVPLWKYFAQGSFHFNIDTISTIPITVMQIYALDKGSQKGIYIQNSIFAILLVLMISIIGCKAIKCIVERNFSKIMRDVSFRIILLLVLLPIICIFTLDYISNYGFWYRQITWVNMPFFIAVGISVRELLKGKKITKVFNK